MSYTWKEIKHKGLKPLGRSSHSIDVINNYAYVMGGEHEPRVPIGSDVWRLDIVSGTWSKLSTSGVEVPPRNAHASAVVGSSIYIFGGRQGVQMGEGSLSDMYRLDIDTDTGTWSKVSGPSAPEARSYHAMTAIDRTLYVFGGCTTSGRLNDLHAFHVDRGIWEILPTSDAIEPRGGAGLTSVGKKLYVIGGFSGKEMGDVHEYDTESRQWRQVNVSPSLPPRSVCGVASLGKRVVVIGGEVDPSTLGHAGAGSFTDEVYVLDTQKEESGWRCVMPGGEVRMSPRGWFPVAPLGDDSIILFGGNDVDNGRLDDTFVLEVAE